MLWVLALEYLDYSSLFCIPIFGIYRIWGGIRTSIDYFHSLRPRILWELSLCLPYCGLFRFLTKKIKFGLSPGKLLQFISLLLTYSRSSYVGLGVAIVVIAILRKHGNLFGGLVAFVCSDYWSFIYLGKYGKTHAGNVVTRQNPNWQESIVLIEKAPGFGYGFDTTAVSFIRSNSVVPSKASGWFR